MRHKTARAYMYGYATHIKPQGYTSRPPLLTTNKVFLREGGEGERGGGEEEEEGEEGKEGGQEEEEEGEEEEQRDDGEEEEEDDQNQTQAQRDEL